SKQESGIKRRSSHFSCVNTVPVNTYIYPSQTNLIEQRTAADTGMVHGQNWNKEEQGADADV
ncbi:hypothetical protein, partial [Aeromonas sp. QDB18]|uniref:hypothetical protein n=1 Tax=Aeromonas sp. QDB18 TaxID=2990486 RepID=UPI0022E778AD